MAPANMYGMTGLEFWGLIAVNELVMAERWIAKARSTYSREDRKTKLALARGMVHNAGQHLEIAGLRPSRADRLAAKKGMVR